VRAIAGHVLAQFNDLPSGDLAARVLASSHDPDLQVAALRVLEHVGTAEHLPVVRALARDPEPAVRGNAVRVLGAVGGDAEVATIRAALDDESHWVAIHAVGALKRLGRTDLLRSLVETGHRWSTAVHEVFLPGTP
jgi:HEAT repeat protein